MMKRGNIEPSLRRGVHTSVRRVPSMVCPGRATLWMGTTTQLSSPMALHMSSALLASRSCACLCSPASGIAVFWAS